MRIPQRLPKLNNNYYISLDMPYASCDVGKDSIGSTDCSTAATEFVCLECDSVFKHRSAFRIHKRIHSNSKLR